MARRRKVVTVAQQTSIEFVSADWPGVNEYERYRAWWSARKAWEVANLPAGETLGFPETFSPDQPWSPYSLTGEPNF